MEDSDPPLRSWLFAPGNHERRVEKAMASAAHAVIIDLEDAVPLHEKEDARTIVQAVLARTHRPNLFVRVNALGTAFALDDVATMIGPGLRGVMLPKSESPHDIAILDWLIGQYEKKRDMLLGGIEIVPLLESAAGLNEVAAICAASARVKRLAFGAADFTLDLDITWSPDEHELLPYRTAMVLASRSAGLEAPVDTPWIGVRDAPGMMASARRTKDHGFQGKLCIHPDQIEVVHRVFAPDGPEIERAQEIVSAFEAGGSGVVIFDGKMLDYPVVEAARRLLQDASRLQPVKSVHN